MYVEDTYVNGKIKFSLVPKSSAYLYFNKIMHCENSKIFFSKLSVY